MDTAQEKNDANRTPLTESEIQRIVDGVNSGRLYVGRRGPLPHCPECENHNLDQQQDPQPTVWMRYIGHIDAQAEWEFKCMNCGCQYFG